MTPRNELILELPTDETLGYCPPKLFGFFKLTLFFYAFC